MRLFVRERGIKVAILEIREYPDPLLRAKNKKVIVFDDSLKKIIDDMFETMYANDGLGLAAPQVGINLMIAVVDHEGKKFTLINPVIIEKKGEQAGEEGCLSFPGVFEEIKRPETVIIEAYNEEGEKYTVEASGMLARAFCHEIDHLRGKLIIDLVSPFKRNLIKKRLKRIKKDEAH
ncbi:MAG: peptide deformylase [Acetomicrobium sp.]